MPGLPHVRTRASAPDDDDAGGELDRLLASGKAEPTSGVVKATLDVRGMHCASCSSAVEAALKSVPGVHTAAVALVSDAAEATFDAAVTSAADLVAAVDGAGFTATLTGMQPAARIVESVRLRVGGMTCASCSGAVERALAAVPGVASASASAQLDAAEVGLVDITVTDDALLAAVRGAGFDAGIVARGPPARAAGVDTLTLRVTGMTCAACAAGVEAALSRTPGVLRAEVDALAGRARVTYDPDAAGARDVIAAIESAGFGAAVVSESDRGEATDVARAELAQWRRLFVWAAALAAPVFAVAMVLPMVPAAAPLYTTQLAGFPLDELVKWALTTPVQFGAGWRFHAGAVRALRAGRANMDVLVSLGTNAAYAYSAISILHHHFSRHHMSPGLYRPTDFFETAAMLVAFITLGKYLEAAARGRTGAAVAALLDLAPRRATVVELGPDGRVLAETELAAELVHRGDVLKVLPGTRVPADGVVVAGRSHVDEAMLTGEAAPVAKGPGDDVFGGTVNVVGPLLVRATRVGSDAALAQIVRLVQAAQLAKAPIQAAADRLASVFVPAVVCLSAVTFAAWYAAGVAGAYPDAWLPAGHTHFLFALLFAIAVLVVACPCALGLATPTAVMVGTGVAARHGVLVKGGDALERAARARVVVFDKTGTLTRGAPAVVEVRAFGGRLSEADVLALAAGLEVHSTHPLAGAVMERAAVECGAGPARPRAHTPPPVSRSQSPSPDRTGWGDARRRAPSAAAARRPAGANGVMDSPADWQKDAAFVPLPRSEERDMSWVRPSRGVDVVVGLGVRGDVAWGGDAPSPGRGVLSGGGTPPEPPPGDGGAKAYARVAVGSERLLAEDGVPLPAVAAEWASAAAARCRTVAYVAVDGALAGALAIADPIRPEAAGVVAELRAWGLAVWLVTGDADGPARAVAAALGVDHVASECLPAAKVEVVRSLQRTVGPVVMVGDGVNDAPALAAADVGVALAAGTDVAVEAADCVLVRPDLEGVLLALAVCRATLARVRLNYFWALAYNVVMLPAAAGALYPLARLQVPPWAAGAAMAFSSVSVVCSSLLLRRFRPPPPVLRAVAAG